MMQPSCSQVNSPDVRKKKLKRAVQSVRLNGVEHGSGLGGVLSWGGKPHCPPCPYPTLELSWARPSYTPAAANCRTSEERTAVSTPAHPG